MSACVRVPVYLVEYVYYMTPFYLIRLFVEHYRYYRCQYFYIMIYYEYFCHSALCVNRLLSLAVYGSYRVCLTVMLRRGARMSSWVVPSGRPSLGHRLSYQSVVSLGADSRTSVRLSPPHVATC